jgi:acyl-[acyl-carrier-protein]-phospholipid O-acyltransferase/long-chain-fatty-acid--[acyl-carrier-protein] ligase
VPRPLVISKVDPKWLTTQLRKEGFPNLWIPKFIKKVDEIPLLGTGKLNLRKIQELAKSF